ncbi:hypothetical protein [Novosphingobium kaempferiae]|uniref:hypothetical protein n=1 Tax=Novosphingobium kaempferiae TaxID=2896849 RepID=UPI003B8493DB
MRACAACHGPELEGGAAPALKGRTFLGKWSAGTSLGALFRYHAAGRCRFLLVRTGIGARHPDPCEERPEGGKRGPAFGLSGPAEAVSALYRGYERRARGAGEVTTLARFAGSGRKHDAGVRRHA